MTFLVTLENVGNPDFQQHPDYPLPGSENDAVQVFNLDQAVQACRYYISEFELGGGNWSGGAIMWHGQKVAQISYNGRIWDARPYPERGEFSPDDDTLEEVVRVWIEQTLENGRFPAKVIATDGSISVSALPTSEPMDNAEYFNSVDEAKTFGLLDE